MLYKDGRIAGVQSTLDTNVIPNLYNTPWNVTSFPIIPSTSAPYLSPNPGSNPIYCANSKNQLLAGNTTLQTMVTITGSGYLDFAAAMQPAATSGTLRIVITVDGAVVIDTTSVETSTANRTLLVVGELTGPDSQYLAGGLPIYFRQSLLVQVQDSTGNGQARSITRYVLATPYAA